MNPRHALHPDLHECELEDRCLLFAPGLYASGFLPSTTGSASLVVSGFQNPGSGGTTVFPGPTFYYILVGGNGATGGLSNGTGSAGISVFGLTTNNGFINISVSGQGAGSNSGSSGSTGAPAATPGYSSSVSSGYSTALTSTNNYGISTSPVGSVPVHSFDSASGTMPVHSFDGGTTNPVATSDPNGMTSPGSGQTDPNSDLWNTLLRRNTRGTMSTSPTGMPGMPGSGNP